MIVDFSVAESAAEDAQVDLRIGYEGRGGRGGAGTLAIVFDDLPYLIEFVVQMMLADSDGAAEWIGRVYTDSMGHNTIAYWPNVMVENAPDEDDDEDEDGEEDED